MAPADLLPWLQGHLQATLADPAAPWALASAALAGLLVIVSAFVKTMIPLRWLAVGSNAGFVVYGLLASSPLMVLLHAVLMPVNLWRVAQMVRLTRRVSAVSTDPQQLQVWLRPYMRSRKLRAGAVIFRAGDSADRLHFLALGQIELVELGQTLAAGDMFGEIAFFAPDRKRTVTARCLTPCTVLSIDETSFKELYFQNPEFGWQIVSLIAERLSRDLRRRASQPQPDTQPS